MNVSCLVFSVSGVAVVDDAGSFAEFGSMVVIAVIEPVTVESLVTVTLFVDVTMPAVVPSSRTEQQTHTNQ